VAQSLAPDTGRLRPDRDGYLLGAAGWQTRTPGRLRLLPHLSRKKMGGDFPISDCRLSSPL